MGRRKTNFEDSLFDNKNAWSYYALRLTELAISMFEWKNLPDTVDERYLELILYKNGNAVFFEDEALGFLALQCLNNGYFDLYGIPKKRRAYAINGYQKKLNYKNSVIIYNNRLHMNTVSGVEYYAKRLWDLDRTIDVNCRAQKTPVVLQGTEEQRLSLINLYKEYDGNSPLIITDRKLDLDNALKSVRTDAPFVADKLYQYKTQLWNEALTFLGITNVSYQKKERLISDEVMRSQGGTFASRYSRLCARIDACEKINKMFGLNISVEYRSDYRLEDDEFMLEKDNETGELIIAKQIVNDLRSKSSIGGKNNE